MRCLGVDYGTKRVGLAFGDELGVATPLPALVESDADRRLDRLAEVVRQRRILKLVIGYPYNMDGSAGFKAREVDAFIDALQARLGGDVSVERVDERLTSRAVTAGMSMKQERKLRQSGVIDSASAALILQDYLDRAFPPQIPAPEDFDG